MHNPYTPYPSKILEVIRHMKREFTFRVEYKDEEETKPGQLFEVPMPKYGEAPISVSGVGESFMDLTIRKVGRMMDEVFENYEGSTLLLRGSYGSSFDTEFYKDGKTVVAAGGMGVPPMRGVIEALGGSKNTKQKYMIVGFRNSTDILLRDDPTDWRGKLSLILTTDGASGGYESNIDLITEYIAGLPLVDPTKAKAVVVGPLPTMKFTITELLKKGFKGEGVTISYKRKMCCGLDKCGHCHISGAYIRLDGPVFNYTEAKEMID